MKLYEPFDFFTNKECEEIIEYAKNNTPEPGLTKKDTEKYRNNRVVWYNNSEPWQKWIDMFAEMQPAIDSIETPQISFYTPGEEYKWHVDGPETSSRTHMRYFSLVCEIQSAPGAELEIKDKEFKLQRGQAIIFRSHIFHRATSPTVGERISFTIWARARTKDIDLLSN